MLVNQKVKETKLTSLLNETGLRSKDEIKKCKYSSQSLNFLLHPKNSTQDYDSFLPKSLLQHIDNTTEDEEEKLLKYTDKQEESDFDIEKYFYPDINVRLILI